MKIAVIQSGNSGFFPRYYTAVCEAAEKHGDDVRLFVPNSGRNKRCVLPHQTIWGSRFNWFLHYQLYKLTGVQDVFSLVETLALLAKLKTYKPDVLYFNVINDKMLHIPLFFTWIARTGIPVVWTMHDCRAFTGQCPYFDEVGCERWKSGCGNCPVCEAWIDNTHLTWKIRNRFSTRLKHLVVVTPSEWLAGFVRESFFGKFPVMTIYNGVDTQRFSAKMDMGIITEYGIPQDKKIVLGCAINWENRKGLRYFEELAAILPETYQIVLVGGVKEEDLARVKSKGIICTGRTKTFEAMVALYQSASVFCNPTMADNFPTVNIEALAAGTPVVTFNTGGSPEAIDEHTGVVVAQGDMKGLRDAIIQVVENRDLYTSESCMKRSANFSNRQYDRYVELLHRTIEASVPDC